jgi:methionine synthase II (cobalamin-independent)
LPGQDPAEAVRLVLGEVTELPYLPELPDRGLGADLIGRTAGLLVDLPVEWQPHGWTIASHGGRDLGRARDYLNRDIDAIVEQAQGVPLLKVQVCGPLSLAAGIELPNLHKLLSDRGAFADLTASLAEGVRQHLDSLAAQLPGTRMVLQLDEPSLVPVLRGSVPTPSGYGTVRSLERSVAESAIEQVLTTADDGYRVIHSCAADVPFDLLRAAGADAVSVDLSLIGSKQLDALGELVEAGTSLWLGVIPGTDTALDRRQLTDRVTEVWSQLGFSPDLLAESVVLTPTCGLAGASPAYVRRAASVLREVGRSLTG